MAPRAQQQLPVSPIARDMTEADERAARFWAKVSVGHPDECWPWQAYVRRNGYGAFGWQRPLVVLSHRAVLMLLGAQLDGLEVDHRCHSEDEGCLGGDTCPHRRCCNPAHLEVVTGAENRRRATSPTWRATCRRGHLWADHGYRHPAGYWVCRACGLTKQRQRRAKAAA